jgi:hypothetical protein
MPFQMFLQQEIPFPPSQLSGLTALLNRVLSEQGYDRRFAFVPNPNGRGGLLECDGLGSNGYSLSFYVSYDSSREKISLEVSSLGKSNEPSFESLIKNLDQTIADYAGKKNLGYDRLYPSPLPVPEGQGYLPFNERL